jgi:hypothetical protein
MLIPRGKPLYENLATSYVLVDALVTDLCEGGFSGVVEVLLRDRETRVLILRGRVAGVIENNTTSSSPATVSAVVESRRKIAELAVTARRERGRVAVYAYAHDTAAVIAGRTNAQPLYTQLSTDFADLDKMLAKLSRERDRQWFIEIKIPNNVMAFLHVNGDRGWLLIASGGELLEETRCANVLNDERVRRLLDECNRAGGIFDVYFCGAHDEIASDDDEVREIKSVVETVEEPAPVEAAADHDRPHEVEVIVDPDHTQESDDDYVSRAVEEAKAVYRALAVDDPAPEFDEPEKQETGGRRQAAETNKYAASEEAENTQADLQPIADGEPANQETKGGDEQTDRAMEITGNQELPPAARHLPPAASSPRPLDVETARAMDEEELLMIPADLGATGLLRRGSTADVMVEIKRLMAEIARTLEESVRAAEQRDSFSMHIRTGQLQVADRYPFLDPFGAEFEYLAGEIVFVGHAPPEEFVAGLTEALKLAVAAAIQASPQPARLRSIIAEDLRWLREHQKLDLAAFELDQVLEEILPVN